MFNFFSHQGKANQDDLEVPPHQVNYSQQMLVRMQGKESAHTLLLGL
jgi:hypothetical protein